MRRNFIFRWSGIFFKFDNFIWILDLNCAKVEIGNSLKFRLNSIMVIDTTGWKYFRIFWKLQRRWWLTRRGRPLTWLMPNCTGLNWESKCKTMYKNEHDKWITPAKNPTCMCKLTQWFDQVSLGSPCPAPAKQWWWWIDRWGWYTVVINEGSGGG